MIKIIMNGCSGKMGQVITSIVENDNTCEIVAGIDPKNIKTSYPIFNDINNCNIKADCIIDFSTSTAIPTLLEYAKNKKLPIILCSTGLTDDINNKILEYSQYIPILKSSNMSIGINIIMKVLKQLSPILANEGFDIEIIEKHHNQKIDAPSGTALSLAETINSELKDEYEYVFDRSSKRETRSKKEIGISVIRGGTIVGEHDIIFAGRDEIIKLSHIAHSKELFAVGAVKAAKYIIKKPAGFYTMEDVIEY